MAYALGFALFALGIIVSVCLHEAGHMGTAKAFGMKVTQYFVGFGTTLWSFKRGETEYGVKAIPAGGFVKIVGMTPLDDDVDPADEHRVFWRKPLWKRTVVLSAGSATHFVIGFLLLWIMTFAVGVPNVEASGIARAEIGTVQDCVIAKWEIDKPAAKQRADCGAEDPVAPAKAAGLRAGDVVTEFNGRQVSSWEKLVDKIRAAGGSTVTLSYERGDAERTVDVKLVATERPKVDKKTGLIKGDPKTGIVKRENIETVGTLGVTKQPIVTAPLSNSVGAASNQFGQFFVGTFTAMKKFPEKVPKLFAALAGEERDKDTPISVLGASRLGGEAVEVGAWYFFLSLLAGLNLFIGVFNLIPLLPLDGGHIAIAWYERARSWVAARRGRPDPGRVDYTKLMPITYVVILVFGGISLLTLITDVVNPITLAP